MHIPNPLPLAMRTAPFDNPDWIFEIKHDGFLALAVIEGGQWPKVLAAMMKRRQRLDVSRSISYRSTKTFASYHYLRGSSA